MAGSRDQKASRIPTQLELGERLERAGKSDASNAARAAARRIYSVTHLVRLASRHIEARFCDVWVEGEVSNLRQPASGHAYFTLKDAGAQLATVAFRATLDQLGFVPRDGQLVRCRGRLAIYESQGRFQLTVEQLEPAGLGALQLAFEQLKRKLRGEGLFDERRKKRLPRWPRTIAVVTSPSGAAIHDISCVLRARLPVRVLVCPTPVQGAEAALEICAALRQADRSGADIVIVARGGGSIEDLWSFNDERVARQIAALKTPVISAVGHETDVVIADFVADVRAPTPSAAAEIAVPAREEVAEQLSAMHARLARAISQQVQLERLRLERSRGRLGTPRRIVDRNRMQVDDATMRLQQALERRFRASRTRLAQLQMRLSANRPAARLLAQRGHLEALRGRLEGGLRARLAREGAALGRAAAALDALSPLAVLARGYSLARDARGQLVRDAASIGVGERLSLRLARGSLDCRVEQVHPEATPNGPGGSDGENA